jgi:N-acetylglucosaminyldiphosphoundecaprenol N-acetyl-beta-D-mannosaminyltransferase
MANDPMEAVSTVRYRHAARTDFRRPVYCLLGVPIDAVTLHDAGEILTKAVQSGSRCVMTTPNLNNLVAIQRDPAFRDAVIRNEFSVADGMPLVWISRLLGMPVRERVAGSDLFDWLAGTDRKPVKVYFFGGPDGAAQAACDRLNASPGAMRCVGFESPGFGTVEELSRPDMIERINRSNADLLVIAMGTQKGHVWIERNRPLLQVQVISHLGAVINFVGGSLSRAPLMMRRLGMEWLWRIKEEPVLWRRYWNDGKAFLPLVFMRVVPCMAERLVTTFRKQGRPAKIEVVRHGRSTRLKLSGFWCGQDLGALREVLETETRECVDIELDFGSLDAVDEAFIGLLMLLYGHQSKLGRAFSVRLAGPRVRRAFRRRCAEFLIEGFPVAEMAPGRQGSQ